MKNIFCYFYLLASFLIASCKNSPEQTQLKNRETIIATSDSVNLFVKVAGKGTPCIFIHGGPGAWSKSFEDMGGSKLENYLTMVYFDQRGSGRSTAAANKNYSLDRMIEDIEHIRDSLKVDKVYIMSHSFGGILAYNYAHKYPQHVKALILVASVLNLNSCLKAQTDYISSLTGEKYEVKNSDSVMVTGKKVKLENQNPVMMAYMKARHDLDERHLGFKTLTDDSMTEKTLDSIDHKNPSHYDFARNVWNFNEYFTPFDTGSNTVNVPVLVINGDNDHAAGVDNYKSFHFPKQKVVHINGGHELIYENNKEFVEAVAEFVNHQ